MSDPSDKEESIPSEKTPLNRPQLGVTNQYSVPLKGLSPSVVEGNHPVHPVRKSMHEMSNLIEESSEFYPSAPLTMAKSLSYSVAADGTISHRTPLQMGRHELYEQLPFTAVFGLQSKERDMSLAVASYAADLDILEADQIAYATTHKHLSRADIQQRRSQASLMLMDELELDKVMVTTPLIFAVFVAAMGQFLVGYNIGVMNAPVSVVFPGHTTAEWSFAVAAFCFGGPFGAAAAGQLAESRGRRGALLICTWTFILGGLLQTFAMNMLFIIIARFIIGLASGISSVIVPIYLGELAPPTLRGTLGTMTQFSTVVGILISDLFAFPLATETKWRMLFSITCAVSFLQLLCAPWLLESPRWLLSKNSDSRKARWIIKKLRGLRYDHEVDTEVDHFVSAMQAQTTGGSSQSKSSGGLSAMLNDKDVRLLVVSSFVLQTVQQLSGINAVFYYSTSFFEGIIDNPLLGTTLVGAVNVLATYAALLLMDSCGRRTLILWSTAGMFFSCVVIVASLLQYLSSVSALIAVNVYVVFFEIGLGPIPWLIVAEMFDAKYVSTAMSASSQLNWGFNFVVGLVFPYMVKYLGPYSFVPFSVVLLGGFCFAWFFLPETQGTTPEELQAALVKRNSSTVYHNMSFANYPPENPVQEQNLGDEWRKAMDLVRREEQEAMESGEYNYGFKMIDEKALGEDPDVTDGFLKWGGAGTISDPDR